MRYQQNLVALPLAIILINGPGTRLQDIQPLLPKVLDALRTLQPRSVVEVTP
jgi:hypothetical protein